ncbi:MAG TPA: thiamine pyrophosphate-dependent dehydrogenase E1 component subunit alpha [Dehalococcoidia bacterium]|jgi:pyruvate dehydrogenase E1 component alpha subunit|nr:thiamine pyrophosphate-dependent dehydrogenase E1 component subunit alpha [Dehalococcoidia bacterium]
MAIEKEKLKELYRTMVRIRRFEERVAREFAEGNIPGSVHLYIGEEAVATGAIAHLRKDDYIMSTHRGHGHLIAKGGDPRLMMAELFAKKTGYCLGKGGSMHIASLDIGMLGAAGIVGSGIPIATGAGLSAKLRGTDQVTICFFGDGAANIGRFHEGINLASVWCLPVVFVCENNLWAVSVPTSCSLSVPNVADRAAGYGIPGVVVDGMDVMAVYEAAGEAVARARRGEGPTLIEAKTYRFRGHFEGDAGTYRPKEEVEEWLKRDPVNNFKEKLIKMKVLTEKEAEEIDQAAREEMDEAVKFALESPFPEPEEALKNVYS